jgi:putative chitinase
MISLQQVLKATVCSKSNAEKFLQPIVETCEKYEINTPARRLCFLAQVGHESGGLFYTEELASGKAYEGRKDLGNTQPGDGVRYKGRGIIQITGRANYASLSQDLGVDFINNPTLLGGKNVKFCTEDQLRYAAMSAGWYWNRTKLNAYADKINIAKPIESEPNLQAFKDLTRRINGGYNGLQDRVVRFRSGQKCFQEDKVLDV